MLQKYFTNAEHRELTIQSGMSLLLANALCVALAKSNFRARARSLPALLKKNNEDVHCRRPPR